MIENYFQNLFSYFNEIFDLFLKISAKNETKSTAKKEPIKLTNIDTNSKKNERLSTTTSKPKNVIESQVIEFLTNLIYCKNYDFVPLPLPSRYHFKLPLPSVHHRYRTVHHRFTPSITVFNSLWLLINVFFKPFKTH